MLKDLLIFWWETHEPWLNGPFFSNGGILPFGALAWPAMISYGLIFEIHRRNKLKYLKFVPAAGICFLFISLLFWYLTDLRGSKELLYSLTWSLAWIAGTGLYFLPSFLWKRKQKRKSGK